MTAALSPTPKLQFFDANGNPLVGGKLYSYAAGTTTPLATYTDATGTTPAANPIILNGRGEMSLWLGDAAYKLKLTTATDVEVWTVDNVEQGAAGLPYTPAGTSLLNGVVTTAGDALNAITNASTGSQYVGFLQAGLGAVTRTAQAKMRDIVSVKDFGAVGDGVNDDTAAIQSALNNNSVVYVPHGTYRCDGCIVVPANKTLIVAGKLRRLSAHSASTRPVVKLFGEYASLFGFGLTSEIKSENSSPAGVVLWGSESPTTEYVAFRWACVKNISIVGAGPSGSNKGLALYNSQLYIGGALYDGHFSDLWIYNCRTSVYLNPISNGNTFHNLNIWNTEGSIVCDGTVGGLVTDNNFTNLFTDNSPSQSAGVYARYTSHSNFVNMNGEPGLSGRLCDIDNTCSRITFVGVDNYVSPPSFNAGLSFYAVNGDIRSTDVSGTNIAGTNLTMTGGTTTFQDSASSSSYNRLRVQPTVAAFGGSGGVALLPGNVPGSGTAQFWTYFKDQVAGAGTTKHNVAIDGEQRAASFGITGGGSGASGSFTTVDGKTVTVSGGIITAIV